MLERDIHIAPLIVKYLEETLSDDERSELMQWANQSTAHLDFFEQLQQPALLQQYLNEYHAIDVDPAFVRLKSNLQQVAASNKHIETDNSPGTKVPVIHRVHFLKTTWFRYAAAIIIIVTGAAIWYAQYNHSKSFNPLNPSSRQIATISPGRDRAILTLANGQQIILDSTQGNIVKQGDLTVVNLAGKLKYEGVGTTTEYNTISTPKGGQYQIVLPDGSKVWLNAASSIKFPTAFKHNERNVEITGEAYMEIEKSPKQSFVVRANGTEIQVLGTSFNINAYEDESAVRTTLIDGSVKVISAVNRNFKSVILKPGQQSLLADDQLSVVNNADMEQALAWKNGVFQLGHTSLAETMRQLARWYDIEVIYENGIPDIQLDGDVKRSLTLSQVMDGLGELGVKFRMEGRRLIVLAK